MVRFSATNSGSDDATIQNFTATNDKGVVYEELPNRAKVAQWAGYLRVAKSGDTVQGIVLFDAPAGHYKLKIADDTGGRIRAGRPAADVQQRDAGRGAAARQEVNTARR